MTHLSRCLLSRDIDKIRNVDRTLDNIWHRMRFTGANLVYRYLYLDNRLQNRRHLHLALVTVLAYQIMFNNSYLTQFAGIRSAVNGTIVWYLI